MRVTCSVTFRVSPLFHYKVSIFIAPGGVFHTAVGAVSRVKFGSTWAGAGGTCTLVVVAAGATLGALLAFKGPNFLSAKYPTTISSKIRTIFLFLLMKPVTLDNKPFEGAAGAPGVVVAAGATEV